MVIEPGYCMTRICSIEVLVRLVFLFKRGIGVRNSNGETKRLCMMEVKGMQVS